MSCTRQFTSMLSIPQTATQKGGLGMEAHFAPSASVLVICRCPVCAELPALHTPSHTPTIKMHHKTIISLFSYRYHHDRSVYVTAKCYSTMRRGLHYGPVILAGVAKFAGHCGPGSLLRVSSLSIPLQDMI